MTNILIGTSGYDYKWWKGGLGDFEPFYKTKNILQEYSTHFNFVELNSPFYKTPTIKTVKKWCDSTPDNFKFVVKVSKTITHNKKLVDFEQLFPEFYNVMRHLKGKLAGFLIQLPPSFKNTKNKSKIDGLTPLERVVKVAKQYHDVDIYVEFRDESWFCDHVYESLKGMWSVVFVSCGNLGKMKPGFSPTLDNDKAITIPGKIYFRNHGTWLSQPYCGSYTEDELKQMVYMIQENTIVVFDNTDSFAGQIECPFPGKMLLSKDVILKRKLIPHAVDDAKRLCHIFSRT